MNDTHRPSKTQLTFSMESGERIFTAESDGDIVRVTIRGEKDGPHEYYYLDEQEVTRLMPLLNRFLGERGASAEPRAGKCPKCECEVCGDCLSAIVTGTAEPPKAGRYHVELNHCGNCAADFHVTDGDIDVASEKDALVLATLINGTTPYRESETKSAVNFDCDCRPGECKATTGRVCVVSGVMVAEAPRLPQMVAQQAERIRNGLDERYPHPAGETRDLQYYWSDDGKPLHKDCGGEVLFFKEGISCSKCTAPSEEESRG